MKKDRKHQRSGSCLIKTETLKMLQHHASIDNFFAGSDLSACRATD